MCTIFNKESASSDRLSIIVAIFNQQRSVAKFMTRKSQAAQAQILAIFLIKWRQLNFIDL